MNPKIMLPVLLSNYDVGPLISADEPKEKVHFQVIYT